MTAFLFSNNVNTTLAGSISPSSTSLTVSSSSHLPSSIPAGYYYVLTLNDEATRQNYEVIYATAVSGATFSGLLRGQEGTTALSWLVGDFVFNGITSGQMANAGQLGASNDWISQNTFADPIIIPPGVSSNEAVNLGQFPSSLTSNGYKKYPDPNSPSGYYIEQWGQATVNPNSTLTVTLPIAFPNAILQTICSLGSSIAAGFTYSVGIDPVNNGQVSITLITTTSSPLGVHWRVNGY